MSERHSIDIDREFEEKHKPKLQEYISTVTLDKPLNNSVAQLYVLNQHPFSKHLTQTYENIEKTIALSAVYNTAAKNGIDPNKNETAQKLIALIEKYEHNANKFRRNNIVFVS